MLTEINRHSGNFAEPKADARPPEKSLLRASLAALEFFFDQIPQSPVFQSHVGIHALQLRKLMFHLFEPLQVRRAHATVLRFPLVVRGIRDPMPAADLLNRTAGIRFLENADDLGFRKTCLLHQSLLGVLCQKTLFLYGPLLGEAYV